MTDDVKPLTLERDGDVAVITLNRPAVRNAINRDLAAAGCAAIEACADAGAIVLTGADPAFCAGMDLRNLGVSKLADMPKFRIAIMESSVPIIGAVNGPAVTGGMELALACDFLVASEKAQFADSHMSLEMFPGPAFLDLPRRVGLAWSHEILLAGTFVDAETALRIGLVNHVVAHEDLMPNAMKLAHAIARNEKALVRSVCDGLAACAEVGLGEARAMHLEYKRQAGNPSKGGAELTAGLEQALRRAREQHKN
jgi:enoyl-CoA hydratase